MADEVVGWLEILSGCEGADIYGRIEVCGNEQFILGRDPELCRYCWSDDLTISRQHLRIHCILYEQDPCSEIAPFVYATDLSANGTCLKKSNSACTGSQGDGILMSRNSPFLLDADDELVLSETVRLVFRPKKKVKDTEFTTAQEAEISIFAHQYLVTRRLLGEGGYGKVLIAVEQATQRQLACKVVRLDHLYDKRPVPTLRLPSDARENQKAAKRKRWPTRVAACFREFDILKDLSHPNIVAIDKVFWSQSTIYIFQELVTGGDLFSFLEYKGGRLDDVQAAVIIRQVLIGVEYLHGQGVVHRDLKPDNILMTSLEDGARVVITDFGNARFLPNAKASSHPDAAKYQRMFSYVGTLEFAAPEIHKANRTIPVEEGYSKSVDMWSIGSVTAALLSGDVIFTNRNDPDYSQNPRKVIMYLAGQCDLSMLDDEYHPIWTAVADRPKDFIKRLLVLNEVERMTASEALAHDWFAHDSYAEDLEAVYDRSIADWQPRQTHSQLVERISRAPPNLEAIILPGSMEDHDDSSRCSDATQKIQKVDDLQAESTSPFWRINTPLPSILDEDDRVQFASQVCSDSYDLHHTETGHRVVSRIRHIGSYHKQTRPLLWGRQGPFTTSQGLYVSQDHTEENVSNDSTESLNNVTKTAYSQFPHDVQPWSTTTQGGQEYVQVHNTPLSDQINGTWPAKESYRQAWFPEKYRHNANDEDESVKVIRETPLDGDGVCYLSTEDEFADCTQ